MTHEDAIECTKQILIKSDIDFVILETAEFIDDYNDRTIEVDFAFKGSVYTMSVWEQDGQLRGEW